MLASSVAASDESRSPCKPAVARFLQYLRVERNASALTIKSYREDLEALVEYLTELRGGRARARRRSTTLDLRGYVAACTTAGYAKTTIARRLASLRSFFRFGQREGWTKTNPAKPLRNPRKAASLPHFLSTDEIGRLLAAPPADEPLGLRDRAILETLYSAGLRVSELVGLNDGDLDLDARHAARARQGTARADRAGRLVRRAGACKNWLNVRRAQPCARSRPRRRRCSSTSSAAG